MIFLVTSLSGPRNVQKLLDLFVQIANVTAHCPQGPATYLLSRKKLKKQNVRCLQEISESLKRKIYIKEPQRSKIRKRRIKKKPSIKKVQLFVVSFFKKQERPITLIMEISNQVKFNKNDYTPVFKSQW